MASDLVNKRVMYVGSIVPRLVGELGRVVSISRNGWAEVDFDAIKIGPLKIAPENLREVNDAR